MAFVCIDEGIGKIIGLIISRYDVENKRAYHDYDDGKMEYVEK